MEIKFELQELYPFGKERRGENHDTSKKRKQELMRVADDSNCSDDERRKALVVDNRVQSKPIPIKQGQEYS